MSITKGFSLIEGVEIIIFKSGVYKQVKVYEKESQLYANTMGGYISISQNGVTSVTSIRWKGFVDLTNVKFQYKIGAIGWLEVKR